MFDAVLPYVIVCGNEVEEKYNTVYIGVDKTVKGFIIDVSAPINDTQRIEIMHKTAQMPDVIFI